jgi:hypothetical protein
MQKKIYKQPNKTRKYKISYYVILIFAIIMFTSGLILINNNQDNESISSLVKDIDYFSETVIIADKTESSTSYVQMLFNFANKRYYHRKTEYYLIDTQGRIINTTSDVYNNISIGDKIEIFTADNEIYYTAEQAAQLTTNPNLELIMLLGIILTPLGLFVAIMIFVCRKRFINPY